jgi:hypothetical protein
MRHVGDARLGGLALGDIDGGDQRGALALVGEVAQKNGDVDGRAVIRPPRRVSIDVQYAARVYEL